MKKIILTTLVGVLLFTVLPVALANPAPDGTSFHVTGRSSSEPEYGISLNGLLWGTMEAKYGSDRISGSDFTSLELNYYHDIPLLKNLNVAAGVRRFEYRNDDTWKAQIGIQGKHYLTGKTFLYSSTFLGKNFFDQEVGFGHHLTDNLDFNLNYYNITVDDLGRDDPRAEGIGLGVTLKL